MNPRKAALPFAIAALVAGTVGLSAPVINDAIAQAATAPQQGQQPEHHRFDPTRHIEGRIAFLKAELAITDAQLPQWNAFADTLRARAKSTLRQILRGKTGTRIERVSDSYIFIHNHIVFRNGFDDLLCAFSDIEATTLSS